MPLIEGIGDEVTILVGVLLLIVLLVVAWISTHVQERSFISVIIFETRHAFRRRQTNQSQEAAVQEPGADTAQSSDVSQSSSVSQSEHNEVTQSGQSSEEVQNTEKDDTNSDLSNCDLDLNRILGQTDNTENSEPLNNEEEQTISSSDQPEVTGESEISVTELRKRRLVALQGQSAIKESSASQSNSSNDHLPGSSRSNSADSPLSSSPDTDTRNNQSANTLQSTSQSSSSTHNIDQSANSSESNDQPDQSNVVEDEIESDDGRIRIKLKFLTEGERTVRVRLQDTVGDLKRSEFATELADNKAIRFIYNGRELLPDTYTLQSFNIGNNSTVHCLVTNSNMQQNHGNNIHDTNEVDLDLGWLMLPLFGLLLGIGWYCRIMFRQIFNPMSTFILIGLSIFYLVAVATAVVPRRGHEHAD